MHASLIFTLPETNSLPLKNRGPLEKEIRTWKPSIFRGEHVGFFPGGYSSFFGDFEPYGIFWGRFSDVQPSEKRPFTSSLESKSAAWVVLFNGGRVAFVVNFFKDP